jgi:hypothetical protein
MIHPRDFIAEYVQPAIALFQANRTVKHLAVHAITQVDVLASVVAIWDAQRPRLERDEEPQFRRALAARERVLALIKDAHDCHKHGGLSRASAVASQGQRPQQVTTFFLNTLDDSRPHDILFFIQDDGRQHEIATLLFEAMEAWERELCRRGL